MVRAYQLGQRIWPDYSSPFSRQDFTQRQLFACLVMRESLKLSYRRTRRFWWMSLIGVPTSICLAHPTTTRCGERSVSYSSHAD